MQQPGSWVCVIPRCADHLGVVTQSTPCTWGAPTAKYAAHVGVVIPPTERHPRRSPSSRRRLGSMDEATGIASGFAGVAFGG